MTRHRRITFGQLLDLPVEKLRVLLGREKSRISILKLLIGLSIEGSFGSDFDEFLGWALKQEKNRRKILREAKKEWKERTRTL